MCQLRERVKNRLYLPLNEHQHALVPQNRELVLAIPAALAVGKADKVEDHGVYDLVGKRILLVKQDPDEK